MADTDKLHNAINSLQQNADRISAIGKLSEDLLRSQAQLSAGIRQMIDGLGQMDLYQHNIKEEIETIKKNELSNGKDILDLKNKLVSIDSSVKTSMKVIDAQIEAVNKNVLQVDTNQLEIRKEIETIKKIELSNGKDILDLKNKLVSIDSNLMTRLDELKNHITDTNANTVDAVNWNRRLISVCTVIIIAVVVIVPFL